MSESLYILALYRFQPIDDPNALKLAIMASARESGVRGTLIIAHEGINGTIAGTKVGLRSLLGIFSNYISISEPRFDSIKEWPFARLFVHVKSEIVTMGVKGIDPIQQRGTYVSPKHWHSVIDDPEVLVIDTRNDFEVRLGSFAGAENPKTESFIEFPHWAAANAERLTSAKAVAMFCTGGIRCEKATSYLSQLGVKNTLHLEGGILGYLDAKTADDTRFHGECFVFDDRIAVGHGLRVNTSVEICFGCRHPVTAQMRQSKDYEEGVSCPDCVHRTSPAQKEKYRRRHQQLSAQRSRNSKEGK